MMHTPPYVRCDTCARWCASCLSWKEVHVSELQKKVLEEISTFLKRRFGCVRCCRRCCFCGRCCWLLLFRLLLSSLSCFDASPGSVMHALLFRRHGDGRREEEEGGRCVQFSSPPMCSCRVFSISYFSDGVHMFSWNFKFWCERSGRGGRGRGVEGFCVACYVCLFPCLCCRRCVSCLRSVPKLSTRWVQAMIPCSDASDITLLINFADFWLLGLLPLYRVFICMQFYFFRKMYNIFVLVVIHACVCSNNSRAQGALTECLLPVTRGHCERREEVRDKVGSC